MKINSLSNNSVNFKANFVKVPTEECATFIRKYPKYFSQDKHMKLTNDEIITGIALHDDNGDISIDFTRNNHGKDIVEFIFEDKNQGYKKTFQEEMSEHGNFGTALYMFYYHMVERSPFISKCSEKADKVFKLQDLLKLNIND